MAENKTTVETEVKENKFKKMLDLEPIFINKFGPKMKAKAKLIYYILCGILAIYALGVLVSLFTSGFTTFIVSAILLAVNFVVVRMFAEYLQNKQ